MYPDFLVFRRQGGGIVCDILEPHALAWEDSVAKAKGLAAFARDHGDDFGRIQLIAKFGRSYKKLSLDDIETRDKVLCRHGLGTPQVAVRGGVTALRLLAEGLAPTTPGPSTTPGP